MELCDTFRRISLSTWYKLGSAHNLDASLSEETLTELNLLEIQASHPDLVRTKWYSKSEEKHTGADWEWWFVSPGSCVGLRVQAKKLYFPSQAYEAFKNDQRLRLIDEASEAFPRRIPLYLFYNHFSGDALKSDFKYGCEPQEITLHGCSVASAYSLPNNAKKLGHFVPFIYPLSTLTCCGDPLNTLAQRVTNNALGMVEQNHGDLVVSDFLTEKAPNYVYKLIHDQKLTNEDWSLIQSKRLVVIQGK